MNWPAFVVDSLRIVQIVVALLVAAWAFEGNMHAAKALAIALVVLPLFIIVLERHWVKR